MSERMVTRAGLAAALSAAAVLPAIAVGATPALADYAPGPGDIIGVGSDTAQYALDYGANGDIVGDPGYNAAGNIDRLVNFDATPDANGRAAYYNGSTFSSEIPLDPTAVLRAGTYPIQRLDGGSAGWTALLADTSAADPYIDYVTMIGTPTSFPSGGAQVFTLGTDTIEIAAATTTNAPAGLSVPELTEIYSATKMAGCIRWNELKGAPATASTDAIIPIIPPPGSDQRAAFLADLGLSAPGNCTVVTSQDNDPSVISGAFGTAGTLAGTTTNPDGGAACTPNCSVDAIMPFSAGVLNLWNGVSGDPTLDGAPSSGFGYFYNPALAYPGPYVKGTSTVAAGITLLTGTPTDGNPVYSHVVDVNVVYRWSDQIAPGMPLNWAQLLFCPYPKPTTPFFQTPAGKVDIAEAGLNPSFQSCLTSPLT